MSAYAGVLVGSQVASAPVVIVPPTGFSTQTQAYAIGIICTVSAGASLTYSVQVTADQAPKAGGNWNNHDVLTGLTVSANGNIAFPVTGIRMNVTTWSSGSVNMGIAQWP